MENIKQLVVRDSAGRRLDGEEDDQLVRGGSGVALLGGAVGIR